MSLSLPTQARAIEDRQPETHTFWLATPSVDTGFFAFDTSASGVSCMLPAVTALPVQHTVDLEEQDDLDGQEPGSFGLLMSVLASVARGGRRQR